MEFCVLSKATRLPKVRGWRSRAPGETLEGAAVGWLQDGVLQLPVDGFLDGILVGFTNVSW